MQFLKYGTFKYRPFMFTVGAGTKKGENIVDRAGWLP
ncbi:hypothetical protein TH47_10615 [Thalassospira sp. MCCC 1A02803]|jgi:hypothetical protein|nr:hypothetical protein TH47_10615 [Thalassospira sp. MCCC 1A02803]